MNKVQPAAGYLRLRRITNRRLAEEYGCNPFYVGRILNGRDKPPRRFKAFLADYLGLSESELFEDVE